MNYKEKLKNITTIVFDFDGVFTDGIVYLLPPKEFLRTMNVRDSYAVQYAVKKEYRIAIITGGNSEMVTERMQYLGVNDVFLRSSDKVKVFENYIAEKGISAEEVLYMGDDLPDYHLMSRVGLSVCPNDAVEEIRGVVDYVSPIKGGQGCVREIIEQVLKAQGKWFDKDDLHW